jgi:hypothetical protein
VLLVRHGRMVSELLTLSLIWGKRGAHVDFMFVFGPPNLRRSRNNWHGDPCSLWPSCSRRRILVGSVQALLYFICQEWKVSQGPEFWNPLQRYLIIASLVVYYYDEPQHHGNIFTYKNTCLILQYVAYFPVIRNTKLIFANIYVLRKSSTHHQSLVRTE